MLFRANDCCRELEERIRALEVKLQLKKISDVQPDTSITVFGTEQEWVEEQGGPYRRLQRQQIPVRDVVHMILDHLGLKLKYVAGTPTRVEMGKQDDPVR